MRLTLEYGPESTITLGTLRDRWTLSGSALWPSAGVSIDTVRYYERGGLLAPKARLASGYRRYSELEVARLRFIRRAQALGFSLKEVKQLLTLSNLRDVSRA